MKLSLSLLCVVFASSIALHGAVAMPAPSGTQSHFDKKYGKDVRTEASKVNKAPIDPNTIEYAMKDAPKIKTKVGLSNTRPDHEAMLVDPPTNSRGKAKSSSTFWEGQRR
jgi:hypothetical protein